MSKEARLVTFTVTVRVIKDTDESQMDYLDRAKGEACNTLSLSWGYDYLVEDVLDRETPYQGESEDSLGAR